MPGIAPGTGIHSEQNKQKSFCWKTKHNHTMYIIIKCNKHNDKHFLTNAFPEILYPAKLSFSSKDKTETFSDIQQIREFLMSRCCQRKMKKVNKEERNKRQHKNPGNTLTNAMSDCNFYILTEKKMNIPENSKIENQDKGERIFKI